MTAPNPLTTPLVDPRTGLIAKEWLREFPFASTSASASAGGGVGDVVTTAAVLVKDELVIAASANTVTTIGGRGTTTKVLHGSTTGAPTFGPVRLDMDVAGSLPVANLGGGVNANAGTVWRGDATWGSVVTTVTLNAPPEGLTITPGFGPSDADLVYNFALANDTGAIEALSGTGFAVRTAANTWAQRTLTAGSNITITNPDGVAGNPVISSTGGGGGDVVIYDSTGRAMLTGDGHAMLVGA